MRTAKKLVLDLLDELSSSKSGAAARERRASAAAVPAAPSGEWFGGGEAGGGLERSPVLDSPCLAVSSQFLAGELKQTLLSEGRILLASIFLKT